MEGKTRSILSDDDFGKWKGIMPDIQSYELKHLYILKSS